nr:MAG TPA: hypothetical protein [Caudoviricetes sp.]
MRSRGAVSPFIVLFANKIILGLYGVWELASLAYLRRLVFVRLGALVACPTVVVLAFLAVARAVGCLALTGTALSEQLVQF